MILLPETNDVDLNPTTLHEVEIRVLDNDHCERLFDDANRYNDVTKDVLICASGDINEAGKDSCQVRINLKRIER